MSVIGVEVDPSAGWFIKNLPSAETAYCGLNNPGPLLTICAWNRPWGVPYSNFELDGLTGTAMSFASGAMKYSSFPSARHLG